jgi:hypothetical protein
MNASLGTNIADVDVNAIAAADPLFPPNLAKAERPTHISPQAGKALHWMFAKRTAQ